MPDFDATALRAAMRDYLDAADRLDRASRDEPRALLDLAERKSVAALALRRRLELAGWTAPVGQRTT